MKRTFLLFLALLLASSAALAAEQPKRIGIFGAWTAYIYQDKGGNVCFMAGQPSKKESSVKTARRGEAFLYITHWAASKTKNVVSVAVGYPFREDSTAAVTVDGKAFSLFTRDERAWTQDQATDDALASAISKGSSLTVRGTSKRGTETTDTYSLKGSGDAYKAIGKACGV